MPPTLTPAILGDNRDLPKNQQERYLAIRQQKRAKLSAVPEDTAEKELLDSLVEKTWMGAPSSRRGLDGGILHL